MTDDGSPKTAYELTMERLRKKDADAGIERRDMSDAQRAAIAEARNFYDSKLAEREVLYQSAARHATDPEVLATLEQEYRRDREHLSSERDAKIERLRRE
jgi:hypothetical protein